MIYYESLEITIRDMVESDVAVRMADDIAHGWETSYERHRSRVNDAAQKRCIALAADYDGHPAGFVSIYFPARTDLSNAEF